MVCESVNERLPAGVGQLELFNHELEELLPARKEQTLQQRGELGKDPTVGPDRRAQQPVARIEEVEHGVEHKRQDHQRCQCLG